MPSPARRTTDRTLCSLWHRELDKSQIKPALPLCLQKAWPYAGLIQQHGPLRMCSHALNHLSLHTVKVTTIYSTCETENDKTKVFRHYEYNLSEASKLTLSPAIADFPCKWKKLRHKQYKVRPSTFRQFLPGPETCVIQRGPVSPLPIWRWGLEQTPTHHHHHHGAWGWLRTHVTCSATQGSELKKVLHLIAVDALIFSVNNWHQ